MFFLFLFNSWLVLLFFSANIQVSLYIHFCYFRTMRIFLGKGLMVLSWPQTLRICLNCLAPSQFAAESALHWVRLLKMTRFPTTCLCPTTALCTVKRRLSSSTTPSVRHVVSQIFLSTASLRYLLYFWLVYLQGYRMLMIYINNDEGFWVIVMKRPDFSLTKINH